MTLIDPTTSGLIADIGLVLLAVASAVGGWRRGALVGAASLAGLIAGFWIGSQILPPLLQWMSAQGWSMAEHPAIVSAIVLLGCALLLQSLGFAGAAKIRGRLGNGVVGRADSLSGTLFNLVTLGVVVWLAAGFVRTTPFITANAAVADSRIVAGLDRMAPVPSTWAMGSVSNFMERNGFPRVFIGEAEQNPSVDAPAAGVPQAVRSASGSVVRVLASAPSCGSGSEGSGWVATGNRVVTNAHVVAGADRIVVQVRGTGPAKQANLIAFDPRRDVAVLHVDGLAAQPLPVEDRLGRGDPAFVAGFPGNGPYSLSSGRVRQSVTARGLDIYDTQ